MKLVREAGEYGRVDRAGCDTFPVPIKNRLSGRELELRAAGIEIPLTDILHPLDLAAHFTRQAPVEIDLGCGDGRFLILSAVQNPAANFLGIERRRERVNKTCRKAVLAGCENVRVLLVESSYAVRYLLPKRGVARLHILFPDPWPKRRHGGNRLLTAEFFRDAAALLAPGGEIRFKTDNLPYFDSAFAAADLCGGLVRASWNEPDPPIRTTFEQRFAAEGLPVHAARWIAAG